MGAKPDRRTVNLQQASGSPVDRVYDFGYSQTGSSSTTTSTQSSRSLSSPTAGRCSTATSSPSRAGPSSGQLQSTSASRRRRTATRATVQGRRHADHRHDVRVGLADRDRRAPAQQHARQDRYRAYDGRRCARHARRAALLGRARGHRQGRPRRPAAHATGPAQPFPSSIFFDAALRNLDWWVRLGIAPPHADPILVSGSPPAPVLDEFGNVQGGCARHTSTCRRARGSGARRAPRSAASPGTRSRSARRNWPSSTTPTATTSARSHETPSGSWPTGSYRAGRHPTDPGRRPRECSLDVSRIKVTRPLGPPDIRSWYRNGRRLSCTAARHWLKLVGFSRGTYGGSQRLSHAQ